MTARPLPLVAALALITACNGGDVDPVTITLSGQVIDQVTGEPVVGATVSADGASATTGDDGSFSLTGLAPGQRLVRLSGEGYASATREVALPVLTEDQNLVPVDEGDDLEIAVRLPAFPTTSRVVGQAITVGPVDGGPAAGALLQVTAHDGLDDYWFDAPIVSADADDNGTFTVEGVPATPAFTLSVAPFERDGATWVAADRHVGDAVPGGITSVGPVLLENAAGIPVLMDSNFDGETGISPTLDELVATWDRDIAPESVSWSILAYGSDISPAFDLSVDGPTLTWTYAEDSLGFEVPYQVRYAAQTADGALIDVTHHFVTEDRLDVVGSNMWDRYEQGVTDHPVDADLVVTFNKDVHLDGHNADLGLYRLDTGSFLYVEPTFSGPSLTLSTTTALAEDTRYCVWLESLTSEHEGDRFGNGFPTSQNSRWCFRTEGAEVTPPEPEPPIPAPPTDLTLVDTEFDAMDRSVRLRFTPSEGTEEYCFWASDTHDNPEWHLVDCRAASSGGLDDDGDVTYEIWLDDQFDSRAGDYWRTPFGDGVAVSLMVNAISSSGMSGPSNVVTAEDDVAPRFVGNYFGCDVSGYYRYHNTGSEPLEVRCIVWSSEPLGDAVLEVEGAPDDAFTVRTQGLNHGFQYMNQPAYEWWVVLAPGADLRGKDFYATMTDTSGNEGERTLVRAP